jgi:transcriptional regulator with XRE-family HTH domain
MPFHIGQKIKKLAKKRSFKTKALEEAVHISEQSVYRLYNQEVIDSDMLIKLSVTFNENLFSLFREHEDMEKIPDPIVEGLEQLIDEQKKMLDDKIRIIDEKDKRIQDLEAIKLFQQNEIKRLQQGLIDISPKQKKSGK